MTIDYEKLKIAHELHFLYAKQNNCSPTFSMIINRNGGNYPVKYEVGLKDNWGLEYIDLDDLIAKLKELTQPKPKYEVGQKVWVVDTYGQSYHTEIDDIDGSDGTYFINEERWYSEGEIYPSREALIEAQIEYWTCLKNEKKTTGYDDMSMTNQLLDSCQHCGEFYK